MNCRIPAGRYIVAVSGGVDSMVLLDLLSKQKDLDLVVAHFDHGIRNDSDSAADHQLVAQVAYQLGLEFVSQRANLGAAASEDAARQARYMFLSEVAKQKRARAIITAHHQDDLIETAIINLQRGTGWRGLISISQNPSVLRPLLHFRKQDILDYAKNHKLAWREDSTNQDTSILRNHIRLVVMPKLTDSERQKILEIINQLEAGAKPIKDQSQNLSGLVYHNEQIDRRAYSALPNIVAEELMHGWLTELGISGASRHTIRRLTVAVRTAKAGSYHDAGGGYRLEVSKESARLI